MTKKNSTVVATKSEYIDPLGCNSTVSYKVINYNGKGRYVRATVELADCAHKIEWYFGGNTARDKKLNLAKADNAIRLLTEFRTALAAEYSKKRPRKKVSK